MGSDRRETAGPGGSAEDTSSEALIFSFLGAARRRLLLREFLRIAAASAVAGLAFSYTAALLNRRYALGIPRLSLGLALATVLAALVFRRTLLPRVAREADRRLRFQDRLETFLDFRARPDVAPRFRLAQAREAAAALGRADLVRGIPIPRLLWAAPVLFGWMLSMDYLMFSNPFEPGLRVIRRLTASRPADRRAEATNAARGGPDPDSPSKGEPSKPAAGGDAASKTASESPPGPEKLDEGERPEKGSAAEESQASGPGAAGSLAVFSEPPRLYSEPVGRELTPVVEAAPRSAESPPLPGLDAPLRGRISFNIVPTEGAGEGPAGAGRVGGGKAGELRITIDYDAVPAEYRPQVRDYFNTLVRLFQRGADGA